MSATKAASLPTTPNANRNGESVKDATRSSPPKSSSLLPRSIAMAVIAFLGGVWTPPLVRMLRHNDVGTDAIVSSSAVYVPLPYQLPKHTPCTPSNLDSFLHELPVRGLHVVCVEPMYVGRDGKDHVFPPPQWDTDHEQRRILSQLDSVQLTLFKNSHATPIKHTVVLRGEDNSEGVGARIPVGWSKVKNSLYAELGLRSEGTQQQPWAVFTSTGVRIIGEREEVTDGDGVGSSTHIMSAIVASGMIIIEQGGNWLWPGVREGFERTIELTSLSGDSELSVSSRNITIETLSLRPLVLSIKGFLSEDECDYIAAKAEPTLQYSGVSLKDVDKGKAASNWRTSQSTFLSAQDDPILMDIEHRTASLTRVPRNHQEFVQVLRYGHTEKYDAHHDYFDPESYKSDPNTMTLIEHGKRNRFATVFWYLTSVEDGGHTIFPRAGGLRERNYSDCSVGLKVKPQKGKVIIFYSLDASGARDPMSLHGACPVGEGNVKWAANKWIWNAPMGYVK